ncbi:MAG: hypothetical protein HYY06_29240 [Deltaproteobacteria bacterium]|nr:hypothetical protein [Deltaproteobacteria bacterium]
MSRERPLARKNLMVDAGDVLALKKVLGAATESEAVRVAVRDRLVLEEAQAAFDRIRARGGIDDAFGRSGPRHLRRRAG